MENECKPWEETDETELQYWKRRYLEMSTVNDRLQEYIPHFKYTCNELFCARSGDHLEDCDNEYCMEHGCQMQDCNCGRQAHIDAAMDVHISTGGTTERHG